MNNHYHESFGSTALVFVMMLLIVLFIGTMASQQERGKDETAIAIAVEDTKQAEALQAAAVAEAVPAVVEQAEDMMTISYFFTIVVGAGVIIVLLLAYMGGFIRPAPRIVKTDEYGRPYGPWRD